MAETLLSRKAFQPEVGVHEVNLCSLGDDLLGNLIGFGLHRWYMFY